MAVQRKSLIAQPCRDAMISEQRCQQMAFGVTIPGSMPQHIGGLARHRIQCVVDAMLDRITDKMKTTFDQIMLITRPRLPTPGLCERPDDGQNQ